MAHKGDKKEFGAGAEGHARFKQYDYRAVSVGVMTSRCGQEQRGRGVGAGAQITVGQARVQPTSSGTVPLVAAWRVSVGVRSPRCQAGRGLSSFAQRRKAAGARRTLPPRAAAAPLHTTRPPTPSTQNPPHQNSNMVLTSDVKRDAHEPTGEPETLAGRIKHKMGDRVLHQKPDGLAERKDRSKKREAKQAELEFALPAKSRKMAGGMSVMDLDTAGFYRPRTKETRWVFGELGSSSGAGFCFVCCCYMREAAVMTAAAADSSSIQTTHL
jgi:hypothetical protein